MKVFGIGMMKTGTTTLAHCFGSMDLRHRSYFPKLIRQLDRGDDSELWRVIEGYDSFEDNPWPMFYRQIDERVPGSKLVLTVRRDSETWWRSMTNHARRMGPTAEGRIIYGHSYPFSRHKAHFIKLYEAHNRIARTHFAGRPEDFMEVCWETGSTMRDLAQFLGHDGELPDELPWKNAASNARVSPYFWTRNTFKWLTISILRIDPMLYRGSGI